MPRSLGQHEPGDDVGVVLHLGQDHDVAGAQVAAAPGVGDQVDRLGGVLGEDDLGSGSGRADEAARPRRGPARRGGSPPRRWCTRRGARWRESSRSSGPWPRAPTRAAASWRRSRGRRSAGRGRSARGAGSPCAPRRRPRRRSCGPSIPARSSEPGQPLLVAARPRCGRPAPARRSRPSARRSSRGPGPGPGTRAAAGSG